MQEKILVLDFGGQYNQLIARRVREQRVYAEIRPYNKLSVGDIVKEGYKGIIFTGGPNNVNRADSPHYDAAVLKTGIPVLGICYGDQLLAYLAGGEVAAAQNLSEYGKTELTVSESPLFIGVPRISNCFMSHTDYVRTLPKGFETIATTKNCPCAAMSDENKKLYGVQFHPEVAHTEYGRQIIANFLFGICGCTGTWKMDDFIERTVKEYRESLAGKKVLLGLSGGVDSSVVAELLYRAIGKNLVCVFVDHGFLRKGEGDFIEKVFRQKFGENFIRANAQDLFLKKLEGVTEPEKKRKIIGEEFIRVFESEARKLGKIDVLAQGTIYPDVIESGKGDSAVIKSHHNVGGLPDRISFEGIVEPLRDLFKDEVREVGLKSGLPYELVYRQPFPGPGLAVRIIGNITDEKIKILQEADMIFREEVDRLDAEDRPKQYFALMTDLKSVGVKGDARCYGYTIVLRAVSTEDFMTAEWTRLPYEVLERASSRITNTIDKVIRVVYDVTSKPPATIEWE